MTEKKKLHDFYESLTVTYYFLILFRCNQISQLIFHLIVIIRTGTINTYLREST